jgi:hypothetical protein
VVSLGIDANGEVVQTGRRGGFGYLLGDDGSGALFFMLLKAVLILIHSV